MVKAAKKAAKKKPGTGLARPGDPLIAENGAKVEPENKPTKKQASALQIDGTIDPALYRPHKRRILKELPAAPNVISGIGAVFMFTMMGVGDREIADTLGTTVEHVNELRSHPAYGECFESILAEFINANSTLITSRIASYAQTAVTKIGTLATSAKKEETQFAASKDILDRAGIRPKDQEHRASMSTNDLRIIIVDGNRSSNVEIKVEAE
jgi:hypothetical protein